MAAASARLVDEDTTLDNPKAMAARASWVAADSAKIGPTTKGRTNPKSIFPSMMGNQTHCLGSTNAPPTSAAWAHL
jgi:hypothetical protein